MAGRIPINRAYMESLRNEKGLTQKQLADAAGVEQATYSRWERGEDRPSSINYIKILAKRLGVSYKKLIEENPSPANQPLTKQDIKEAVLEALSESGIAMCPLAGDKKARGR